MECRSIQSIELNLLFNLSEHSARKWKIREKVKHFKILMKKRRCDLIWFDSNHNWPLKFYCSIRNGKAAEIEKKKRSTIKIKENESRWTESWIRCEITEIWLLEITVRCTTGINSAQQQWVREYFDNKMLLLPLVVMVAWLRYTGNCV